MGGDVVNPFISPGFCQCGCGKKTAVAPMTNRKNGYVKGEPYRYCKGHYRRPPKRHYIVDARTGCWNWQGKLCRHGYGAHEWTAA